MICIRRLLTLAQVCALVDSRPLAWLALIVAAIRPLFGATRMPMRAESIVLALLVPYSSMCLAYENYFYVTFGLLLVQLVRVEAIRCSVRVNGGCIYTSFI